MTFARADPVWVAGLGSDRLLDDPELVVGPQSAEQCETGANDEKEDPEGALSQFRWQ